MINEKTRPIKALLVDDEIDACLNLQSILKNNWNDKIEITGFALNTQEAEKMLLNNPRPDVVFIDIEMPGENAFQFLERIRPIFFEIIFVTAYDEYALRALKFNALDYILKPISLEELGNAIKKLEERIQLKELSRKIFPENNFEELNEQILSKTDPDKIVLRSKYEVYLVSFDHIHFIAAEGSYAKFYIEEEGRMKSIIMSYPLVNYEELMPAHIFYRTHKSYLVNCTKIFRIIKDEHYSIVMNEGSTLPLSRRRHLGLVNFLKNI